MLSNSQADKAQAKVVKKIKKRLDKFNIALLWGEIRSGKTRPFLRASEGYRTLVVTKKDAINGIKSEATKLNIPVDVINYHSIDKMDPADYDLTILDECFTPDVEILTEHGFIRFDLLSKNTSVAQYDTNTQEIEFITPTRHIEKHYDGDIITFKSQKKIDISVTPNHNMVVEKNKRIVKLSANDLRGAYKFRVTGKSNAKENILTPYEKLAIMTQADGSLHTVYSGRRNSTGDKNHRLCGDKAYVFSFTKERKVKEFKKLMYEGDFEFSEVKDRSNRRRFIVHNIPSTMSKLLSDNFILSEIGFEKAKEIIEYMVNWDGHIMNNTSYYYSSVVKENTDFYQAVSILAGYKTNQTIQTDDRSITYNDVYRLFISKNEDSIGYQGIEKTYSHHSGKVYCVEVPKGNIIVRRNGKPLVVGNCHLYIANASPKESTTWKKVRVFTEGKNVIYASGTPTAEGYGGLYHMLKLSDHSPFRGYPSFTMWFNGFSVWQDKSNTLKAYSVNYSPSGRNAGMKFVKIVDGFGIPTKTYLGDKEVPSYKNTQEKKIKSAIKHLVVKLKRVDTGHKFEAKDVKHHLKPNKEQTKLLSKLASDLLVETKQGVILGDTPVKMMQKRHQISSGIAVKCEDDELYQFKKESPKVNFIQKHFDPTTTIILAHYIEEQEYLATIFPHTGSVTKMSSGVDLSHFETMVIFSMAFSAANYEQVRGRLMNVNRKTKIKVHYLLIDLDGHVYNAVKGKENFTASWFKSKDIIQ